MSKSRMKRREEEGTRRGRRGRRSRRRPNNSKNPILGYGEQRVPTRCEFLVFCRWPQTRHAHRVFPYII
eukprot:4670854-Pyramimonas_sp.AAC.1